MKLFVDRPIATAMFFMALFILGIYSFMNIPLELAPKEEYPQLNINTTWSGTPPEIIQTEITSPLEEKASTVKGVRKITSSSQIGFSSITLEFDPKTNMEFAHLALREKIAELKDDLPMNVRPQVAPYVPEDFRVEPFLVYNISGDYSINELRDLAKDRMEMGIGAIKGISGVEVTGGSDPEIRITLDEKKMEAYNLHPWLVRRRIEQGIQTYEAGKIYKGQQEYIFKVANPVETIKDMEELIIAFSGENPIKLRDVAKVIPDYGEIRQVARINGQPTLRLTVHKERGTSTLKVARAVKIRLEEIKKELPQDLIFRTVNDEGEEITKNLKDLYLLVGIIITVIFVLVFLVLRRVLPSLLVLSSVAFSVLITFNLIYFFKISLNMLTLGGLALGFGLFVDNSIVVFENVLRMKEKGFTPFKAAVQGSKEVFMPVLAATLTTMSVFFSFAYFQGRMKIYYLPLAIIITLALAASLVVSFSLIPALSPGLLRKSKKERVPRFRKAYRNILSFLIRHPVEVLLIIGFIFYGSYKWFRAEVSLGEFFRWYSKERLYVSVGMPPGTEMEEMDKVIRKFEERALDTDYEREINTNILSPERGYIIISFPPHIERSYKPYLLKEELIQLATNFAGISISVMGFDPEGYHSSIDAGTWYDSRIKFFGYNHKKLKDITSEVERTLKKNPRIKEVKVVSSRYAWFRLDSFEYVLKIDKQALKQYDVDPQYLFYHIAALIQGTLSSRMKVRMEAKERDLTVKFPKADNLDLKELQESLVRTRGGEYLKLREISILEERPIAGSIDREDQQFQQTVLWEFRGPSKAGDRYKKAVFSSLVLPPGFSATLEDERFMTEEEKGQLTFAIIFSLVIIFMILASLYESFLQPFFILLAVPLALIGVFIAFVIADFPFDSSAYIGVILLGGIVVNNSILMVDHINLKRKQGLPLLEAVLEGARERIRPIFLTTSTTVLGIFPLILIQVEEGQRQIWSSLALSAVGGLISSTLFILIAIPIFYYYGDNLKNWFRAVAWEMRTIGKNW